MRRAHAKLALAVVLTILPLSSFTGGALAGDKQPSGKELYKQNCRVCHEKDSPFGEYAPMTLIQDQWKAFFKDRLVPTHKDLAIPGQPQKLLDALTPEQLKAIEKYVVDHAADSEQPQTCS